MNGTPANVTLLKATLLAVIVLAAGISTRADTGSNLASINQVLQRHPIVVGNFVQTRLITGLSKPLVSSGDFVFLKSRGIYWHTLEPVEFETAFVNAESDDSGQQPKQTKPKQNTGPMQKKIGELLMSFLGGNLQNLERQFHLNLTESENSWQLSLLPKRKAVKKHLSELTIEGTDYIDEINIDSENSGTTTIRFNNIQHRAKLNGGQCTQLANYLALPDECADMDQSPI